MPTHDLLVFVIVVCLRLLVPLLIPRFPLPGVLAALLIDAADQTIFQTQTQSTLEGYQAYDKALDIYYLTIAYLATLRNWANLHAVRISRFLFYYRLVGVLLFEVTQLRPLLLVFPNTFEYFFIFYEVLRLRWNPVHISTRTLLAATAFIWVVIKLPQEYWLHVAEMDMTDFIKQSVFGVPANSSWSEVIASNPLVLASLGVILLLLFAGLRVISRKLPPADWKLAFSANAHGLDVSPQRGFKVNRILARRWFDWELGEKILLVSLIVLIFSRIFPDEGNSIFNLEIGLVLLIVGNTVASKWLTQHGVRWQSTFVQFIVWAVVNLSIAILFMFLLSGPLGLLQLTTTLFFVLLLTLIVVLYDRYMPFYVSRIATAKAKKA